MEKMNCWEFKKCERWEGGAMEKELGVCPVTKYSALNGIHGGRNAGRACWVVAGSLCGGSIQGNEEQKKKLCWRCDFFALVKKEEETSQLGFLHTRLGMDKAVSRTASP